MRSHGESKILAGLFYLMVVWVPFELVLCAGSLANLLLQRVVEALPGRVYLQLSRLICVIFRDGLPGDLDWRRLF